MLNKNRCTLNQQIDVVKREISRRKKYFPHLVEKKKITKEVANKELSAMHDVLHTLIDLRDKKKKHGNVKFNTSLVNGNL